mgnify:CR=1 FL=1|jgi:hypothetical protein
MSDDTFYCVTVLFLTVPTVWVLSEMILYFTGA